MEDLQAEVSGATMSIVLNAQGAGTWQRIIPRGDWQTTAAISTSNRGINTWNAKSPKRTRMRKISGQTNVLRVFQNLGISKIIEIKMVGMVQIVLKN